MEKKQEFLDFINAGNTFKGDYISMGAAMLEGETITDAHVKIPLKTLNRHGLIAGATGTGKTKTLQVIAENLSDKGIPVLLMDMKGDLSGIAKESPGHPKIDERQRATVSEFGPVLFSRIIDATVAQSGIVSILFKYSDDKKLPLLDLKDFKKILQYATKEGKEEIEENYGRISPASSGSILRKIVELEQQGADIFFGEKSFDTDDLTRVTDEGRGVINIVRLTDIQDKPGLFSTFMLSLLAEIYSTFPEQGDSDRPELVIFIDEAHLIFKEASKALHNQIESIVKLIRSKGVGLYFVTQNPTDVPEGVLSQLGLKIQHALRAFTAKDRKAIKLTAENYPDSPYYDTKTVLTSLGIGEALVSALDEKGRPTPLAATMLRAPMSRMDILTQKELDSINKNSELVEKYSEVVDRDSAYELLNKKIEKANKEEAKEKAQAERKKASTSSSSKRKSSRSTQSATSKALVKVLTSATVIRGVFGILGKMLK